MFVINIFHNFSLVSYLTQLTYGPFPRCYSIFFSRTPKCPGSYPRLGITALESHIALAFIVKEKLDIKVFLNTDRHHLGNMVS